MKVGSLLLFSIFILSLLSATTAFSEDSLFVQPFRAKLYSKPLMASEVIGTVDSGFQFVSAGKEGSWVKLSYKGKPGYIPAVQTAKTPPLGKSTAPTAEVAPKLAARARTSSTSAVVAGMKGLTYEDRARVSSDERSNFESLDKVDAIKVSFEELESFQQGGGKQ